MADLTAPDSALSHSLDNIEKISSSLTENDNFKVTLQNFRDASDKLKVTMRDLEPVGKNIAEFSDTIKTQPWRLIYPDNKKISRKVADAPRAKPPSPFAKAQSQKRPRHRRRQLAEVVNWLNGFFSQSRASRNFKTAAFARTKIDIFFFQRFFGQSASIRRLTRRLR